MAEIRLKRDVVMVEVPCWSCDFLFMVPQSFERQRRRDGGEFFCPACRVGMTYKSEMEALKRQVAFWEGEYNGERDRHEQTENRRRATAGQLTKLRKRVNAGVCPCCNRHFTNLERHMATKHPGFPENAEV